MTTVGYVVRDQRGPLKLCFGDGLPAKGVLLLGPRAVTTVFPDLKSARRAIKSTEEYADEKKFLWQREYYVTRLESLP